MGYRSCTQSQRGPNPKTVWKAAKNDHNQGKSRKAWRSLLHLLLIEREGHWCQQVISEGMTKRYLPGTTASMQQLPLEVARQAYSGVAATRGCLQEVSGNAARMQTWCILTVHIYKGGSHSRCERDRDRSKPWLNDYSAVLLQRTYCCLTASMCISTDQLMFKTQN